MNREREKEFHETLQKVLPGNFLREVVENSWDHQGNKVERNEFALTTDAIEALKLEPLGAIESDYPGYSATRLDYWVIPPQENDLNFLARVVEKKRGSSAASGGVYLYLVGKIDQNGEFIAKNGGEVLY